MSISYSVLGPGESLVHGNELLNEHDPSYPVDRNYRAVQHTLPALHNVFESLGVLAPAQTRHFVRSPFEVFAGYLLLDALIGNTDRHHENWGVVVRTAGRVRQLVLAPSYDHASSLGRELGDEKRRARLAAKDPRAGVPAYAARAASALYGLGEGPRKPLTCIEAFERACQLDPVGSFWWRARLGEIRAEQLEEIVRRVPSSEMSQPASAFAIALLRHNLNALQKRFP